MTNSKGHESNTRLLKDAPSKGDLHVWYSPQLPAKAFQVSVSTLAEGKKVLETLQVFSFYEFSNRVKPDYTDMGGVSRWEEDGEGGFDWFVVDEEELEAASEAGGSL